MPSLAFCTYNYFCQNAVLKKVEKNAIISQNILGELGTKHVLKMKTSAQLSLHFGLVDRRMNHFSEESNLYGTYFGFLNNSC